LPETISLPSLISEFRANRRLREHFRDGGQAANWPDSRAKIAWRQFALTNRLFAPTIRHECKSGHCQSSFSVKTFLIRNAK
jgi:hypothetical protein